MSFEDLRVIQRPETPRRHFDPVVVCLAAVNAVIFLAIIIVVLTA